MPHTLEDYVRLGYPFEVIPAEEGGHLVRYPDLPGCFAQVEEGEDVLAVASEILEGWLAVAIEDGDPIPLPGNAHRYSGRFVLRVSRTMHADLAREAERDGVSINAYINTILAARHARQSPVVSMNDNVVSLPAWRRYGSFSLSRPSRNIELTGRGVPSPDYREPDTSRVTDDLLVAV